MAALGLRHLWLWHWDSLYLLSRELKLKVCFMVLVRVLSVLREREMNTAQ